MWGRKRKSASPKEKGGWVYFGKSERRDGSIKEYVGMTRKTVSEREGQHKRQVKKSNSRTWTGKGTSYETTGKMWSSNPEKAENTIKRSRRAAYKKGDYQGKYHDHNSKLGRRKRR